MAAGGDIMMWLKKHPFAVEAFFESSVVLAFAVPPEQLAPMIPPCLKLDTFQDRWAFVAIAMVQTKHLRPQGFPCWLGHDFFLIGYRIFVRYVDRQGRRLRGLYILRSETDRWRMQLLGNLFTHYRYRTTDIDIHTQDRRTTLSSVRSGFRVVIDRSESEVALPPGSPFAAWQEARQYAGPLPHTFTYDQDRQQVLIIEGQRQNWHPQPLRVRDYQIAFLDQLGLKNPVLANAFEIKHIPYLWKKGRLEPWP